MSDAEGVIGELKNRHGLDRVRSRGTPFFHVQLLLGCTALNCKRLADHVPEPASGVAGAPSPARSEAQAGAGGACETDRRRAILPNGAGQAVASALDRSPGTWSYVVCLN